MDSETQAILAQADRVITLDLPEPGEAFHVQIYRDGSRVLGVVSHTHAGYWSNVCSGFYADEDAAIVAGLEFVAGYASDWY